MTQPSTTMQKDIPSHSTILNAISSIEQQKEISPHGTILNAISSIEQQKEISSHGTTLNVIPSIEQQKKISPLITRSLREQNEIPSHDTTLNDSNNDNLVTPPIEPSQGMQQEHPQLVYTLRTRDILPHDMENVVKMCKLLEKILKR
ncbi:hypothetical protein TSUD_235330 [Trifolium subterraneum]|uniref:Uncharacterized protein n=1 Tax=Trifolium subterraneum TaxID=3900 RepID=A0A2Z6NCG8_TRISU|nr:hypothetical protein TSUD_235330 [Trifolium subterraneum]